MNNAKQEKIHEPFVRMVKRDGMSKKTAWLIRGGSIIAALLFCSLVQVYILFLYHIVFSFILITSLVYF